jgi:DNA-binding SARP family transcriptional activator
MTCYAELGEKSRVLAHYEELRDLLWQELGVEPSPETVALVETLLN